MSTDIRQAPQFARFMEELGWTVDSIGENKIYMKKFPILGYFAKIPRPTLPLDWQAINQLKKKYRIFKLKIASYITLNNKNYSYYNRDFQRRGFTIEQSPFNPVTTILIDLLQSERNLFNSFTSAKRRAVRRAQKNNVVVKVTDDFESFIQIRKRQYFPMGFLLVKEMHALWKSFYPNNASLFLAYQTQSNSTSTSSSSSFSYAPNPLTLIHATAYKSVIRPIAGILLLYHNKRAYYWLASALNVGKKLFAPTLLVWEALKFARKKGNTIFDFEGIYDERFPKAGESWKGFTKFKEGFGGEKIAFMENFTS